MRLPTDAVLLIGRDADPDVEHAWREERLPLAPIGEGLEAALEAFGTATVVACGEGAAQAAALAAQLGYRTFLVGEPPAPPEARAVTAAEAVAAARGARARERWKAARVAPD